MSKTTQRRSQTSEVLKYLRSHKEKGITSKIAFELFGATRLSAIIFGLNHRGYVIECTKKEGINRYGRKGTYGVYKLISEPKEEDNNGIN